MNREIKFEICTRRKDRSDLFVEILTLDDLIDRNGCYYSPSIQEIVYKRQWTGLKDKNGVDIYEGDILQANRKRNNAGFVSIEDGQTLINYNGDSNFLATHNGFKVIGNIHENPELLER